MILSFLIGCAIGAAVIYFWPEIAKVFRDWFAFWSEIAKAVNDWFTSR